MEPRKRFGGNGAIRDLIDFLPSSNINDAPVKKTEDPFDRVEDSLDTLVPDNSNTPYDIKELVLKVIDEGDFEIQEKLHKILLQVLEDLMVLQLVL